MLSSAYCRYHWTLAVAFAALNACGVADVGRDGEPEGPVTTHEDAVNERPSQAYALGSKHSCVIGQAGVVYCQGNNAKGQIGDGTIVNRPTPKVVPGLSNQIAVAANSEHTCALQVTGQVRCWGNNQFGQLGDNST